MSGTSGAPSPAAPSSQHTDPSRHRAGSTTPVSPGSAPDGITRHAVFLVVLLVGAVVRVVAQLSFGPALVVGESAAHLSSVTERAEVAYPMGYGLLELTPLSWFTDALAPVAAVQHLLGLATGIVVYVLLLRWGVSPWLAALAAVPALWDSYAVASEQLVLPDTLFVFLVAVAVLALCWRARPGALSAVLGGVLVGAAASVRPMGEPLVLAAVVFVLVAGSTWRIRVTNAVAVTVGVGLLLVPYVGWYQHAFGDYALAQDQTLADAGAGTPTGPDTPNGFERLLVWSRTHEDAADDVGSWRFSSYLGPEALPSGGVLGVDQRIEPLQPRQPGADALVAYQSHGYLPGPALLGGLVVGLLAAAGVGRARRSGLRALCLLTTLVPAGMLLGALGNGEASWRDQLPALVMLPAAGALGLTALMRGRRAPAAARSQIDDVDRAALAVFHDRHGDPVLAPVVVVVAAYNEAVGLPRVLSSMPSTVCGLATDVVVVDDGSSDGTPAAAQEHGGAYTVTCPVNRGQGAAMRLGYRVARDHGARYVITTDADAQYDPADFPTVLSPVLDGSADFVSGSRRLGRQHTNDRFRRAGVHVFAWIVSVLTGQRVTDTSFGLRAMRVEVTAAVTLNQPQYQSAELLIGALSHGFRIAEVPATMNLRAAGSTKKGGNLVYGTRYARVVLGTWWREGCPAPAWERAPALRGRPDAHHALGTPSRREC